VHNTDDIPVDELRHAAHRPEVVAAMRDFYLEVDRRIQAHTPVCWNKGECCQFGRYGHRLYVTALEVVYYLATSELDLFPYPPDPGSKVHGGGHDLAAPRPLTLAEDACPHAYQGKCHARQRRPLGCRVFYCDPAAQHWQGPITEELLGRLRQLHNELDIPYLYTDWMTALRALGK
jgi:hypothetical protein